MPEKTCYRLIAAASVSKKKMGTLMPGRAARFKFIFLTIQKMAKKRTNLGRAHMLER
jgi:hypothetical protein